MKTINELENEIHKIYNGDFTVLTISKYKEKEININLNDKIFNSTSTKWDGAIRTVFMQIKKYLKDIK